jgi:hypothetical protein
MSVGSVESFLRTIQRVRAIGLYLVKNRSRFPPTTSDSFLSRIFHSFGLAMPVPGTSFGVRFSSYWQTVGAPVSVSFTFRGNSRKKTKPNNTTPNQIPLWLTHVRNQLTRHLLT